MHYAQEGSWGRQGYIHYHAPGRFQAGAEGGGRSDRPTAAIGVGIFGCTGEHGRSRSQIDPAKRGIEGIDWKAASKDLLFVRKRADALARLLDAKRLFQTLDWQRGGRELLDQLLATEAGNKALSVAL